jgi:hypothetical protein
MRAWSAKSGRDALFFRFHPHLACSESCSAGTFNLMLLNRFSALLCLPSCVILLASCGSSGGVKGVPRNLPEINLQGSSSTPAHSMERKDYPFAPDGTYMTAWASEGEKEASSSDIESWSRSHGGTVSRRNPSPVKKVPASKKKTASSSKSGSSKGGGTYTIKKGDTLGAIARKHGTTVAKLKAANGMSSDFIREGKTLKIPK